jgi:hypothetical protein
MRRCVTGTSAASSPAQPEDDDEASLDLPPFDADDDALPADVDEDLPEGQIERGDLDDVAADDLDVGDAHGTFDEGEDDASEGDFDAGSLTDGIDMVEEAGGTKDEPAQDVDTDGMVVDETSELDDGGLEGTGESAADDVDERALPDLDDDLDPKDDGSFAEALLSSATDSFPPWAPVRCVQLEGLGGTLPAATVVARGGRVAAAGEVLVLVEEGARSARRIPFDGPLIAVALGEDSLLAATSRGQLVFSADGGATLTCHDTGLPGGALRSTDVQATPGRFWLRSAGALSSVTFPEARPTLTRARGVAAIAVSGPTLFAVLAEGGAVRLERAPADDEAGAEQRLLGPAAVLVDGAGDDLELAVAAAGRVVALAGAQSIALSRDGGETFVIAEPGRIHALAFAGDSVESPLLALATLGTAGSFLLEWTTARGLVRLGEVPTIDAAAPAGLAWDPSRDAIWVAASFGLVAFGLPQRH